MTDKEALKQLVVACESRLPLMGQKHIIDELNAAHEAIVDAEQEQGEPLEYWNAVEGWVKIDEVREHFDSVGCGTIYKAAGEDRVPLYTTPQQRKPLTEWQPIETAPTKGRELILLLTPSKWPQVAYTNTWWTSGFSVENKPTHWMPISPIESAHGIKEKNT